MQETLNPGDRPVRLGVAGWEWPAWSEAFYPEDMPEDWRLTYYNTQFACVFLEAARWQRLGQAEWRQWAEDTHDRFLFLLEGEAGQPVPPELRDRALCLPATDPRILWFDTGSALKALSTDLQQALPGPRFLISRDGDIPQLERVRTLLQLLGVGG